MTNIVSFQQKTILYLNEFVELFKRRQGIVIYIVEIS